MNPEVQRISDKIGQANAAGIHLPEVLTDRTFSQPVATKPDLLSQWLGGDSQSLGFLKCTYDLSTHEGVAIASRFQGDSAHDNGKIDGQEFTATGIAISSWQQTDDKTGEVSIRPRLCIGLSDGTHLAFTGMVALRSGLFLLAGIKPEQWRTGVKIRVHSVPVKRGNDGHRFEILA